MKPCPLVSLKYMMSIGSWNCTELWSDVERSIEDVNVDVVLFLRCNSIESATKRVVRQTKRRTNIIHGIFHLQYC